KLEGRCSNLTFQAILTWSLTLVVGEQGHLLMRECCQSLVLLFSSAHAVQLDRAKMIERMRHADDGPGRSDAHAQDAIEHQRQEADESVRTNSVRQAVIHWRDLDVALEHPEAALDVGEGLVAIDDAVGIDIRF